MASKRGGSTSKKTSGFTVEGKSVEELLKTGSTFINRLTTRHLGDIVTRLASAANKRLRRAYQAGAGDSPAIKEVEESGGKFSGKGKDREGLQQEFLRLKRFFQDPTSTMEGWKRVQRKAAREAEMREIWRQKAEKRARRTEPFWEYDASTDTYSHPDYGEGFTLEDGYYRKESDEEVIEIESFRYYHDYDATEDYRKTPTGTETGDIWSAVDSVAKLDPRFASYMGSYDLRIALFNEIDNAFVNNPNWTLNDALNDVANRLDEIFNDYTEHLTAAMGFGASTFFRED